MPHSSRPLSGHTVFEVRVLRVPFTPPLPISPLRASNVLRGAFGYALRDVCTPDEYIRIFEPTYANGPSGFRNAPRPFVLRPRFPINAVDIHFFDLDAALVGLFKKTLARIAEVGIGPERAALSLGPVSETTHAISLDATRSATRVRVEFRTPVDLKRATENQPLFEVLFARAAERVSILARLYQHGELPFDFKVMRRKAAEIQTGALTLSEVDVGRRSTRTGQQHSIGGQVGGAVFEGQLGPFLPWLEAAFWTGVGRHTVWGNGEIITTAS